MGNYSFFRPQGDMGELQTIINGYGTIHFLAMATLMDSAWVHTKIGQLIEWRHILVDALP